MATRQIKKAEKLAGNALGLFQTAHQGLASAQSILEAEEHDRIVLAAQLREDAELAAQEHEAHAKSARVARERNQVALNKLAEFIG